MERDIMSMLYEDIIPIMVKEGLEITSKNRWGFLIGVKKAYVNRNPNLGNDYIVKALNKEIDTLAEEISIEKLAENIVSHHHNHM